MRMQFTFAFRNAIVLTILRQGKKRIAKRMSTFEASAHVLRPQQRRSRAAIARIEHAVADRPPPESFQTVPSLIRGIVGAVSEAYSRDQGLHRFLSNRSI